MQELLGLFKLGGFVLPILILAAIVALAIAGNRLWVLRRGRIAPRDLAPRVGELVDAGKVQQAVT